MADRIKLLLLITSTAGGGGLHALYLARHLPREKFDLTVAFGPGYPLDAAFAQLDLPIVHLPLSRGVSPMANLKAYFRIRRLIRDGGFDIVLSACSIAGLLGRIAAWLGRVPVNAFVIHAYACRPHQNGLKRAILRQVEKAIDLITDRYVAVSQATMDSGVNARIMHPRKVDVIWNGIPADAAPPEARNHVRAGWNIPDDAVLVGTVARLEKQKGIADFLNAVAILAPQRPAARFVVVGEGPLRDALTAQARDLGIADRVLFAGWRDDVAAVMSALDVFCLPSLWEQFPFSVLEAMAASRPVVATRVDGVPEAVVDGETGLLVPSRDTGAMAAALLRVVDSADLRTRMGAAGRARVTEAFSIDEMIRKYDAAFTRWVREAGRAEPVPAEAAVAEGTVTP